MRIHSSLTSASTFRACRSLHSLRPTDAPAHNKPYTPRSHTCGSLNAANVGSTVTLAGWLMTGRKISKSLAFYTLRDASGTTQLISTKKDQLTFSTLERTPLESVLLVQGNVVSRPSDAQRTEPTGAIEVQVESVTVLNTADNNLPFLPSDTHNLPNEDLRLQHRYLDLRRDALSTNIRKRGQVAHVTRSFLHDQGFLEVETPILLKSTPEGAREFLVPSRLADKSSSSSGPSSNLYYALPQSPQQPKQLLICSGGVDKYYQLARCFRDEDGRKDRQPEFTQIDMEMAFVSWGPTEEAKSCGWRIGGCEVRSVVESLVSKIWGDVAGVALPEHFPVITYAEAMNRYGSDKPDLRFGLEIQNITEILECSGHPRRQDDILEALVVRSSETWLDERAFDLVLETNAVQKLRVTKDNASDWLLDNASVFGFDPDTDHKALTQLNSHLRLQSDDVIYLSRRATIPRGGWTELGRLRAQIGSFSESTQSLPSQDRPYFLWVTEFPLFTKSDEDKDFLARGRWSSTHHPFTAPMWEDMEALSEGRVEEVRGQHYDLVLNGVEIGGGSVRIHDPKMQEYIMVDVLQLSISERESFDHLLQALRSGAPPHGGIALGFDRLVAILCSAASIREVIAFPKSTSGFDPLFKSPSIVSNAALPPGLANR
ncbi:hypothetical protein SISSUDRAFT_1067175 [Sistotremastrum suecicum HHB10207 ss-3]|uniref:Aminoacyl-transfer RNA synthetases class-II family profile domain-containing protein n=1 Tax=Sistotremastrum suecicum HHB10207 ss-3 TaxID=1314776 RepID=A0A165XEZ9_9AGAM|nr:hypothetical protein SISSUDRAFT_1067175 [Sistotremastrum suecicum HHB10207 ss-3]